MLIQVATSTQSQNAKRAQGLGSDWILVVLFKFGKIKYFGSESEYLIS